MTPKLKKWLNEYHEYHSVFSNPTKIIEDAWLEATRQAYEDAARICEKVNGQSKNTARKCLEAIRAKAKEYDNEKI